MKIRTAIGVLTLLAGGAATDAGERPRADLRSDVPQPIVVRYDREGGHRDSDNHRDFDNRRDVDDRYNERFDREDHRNAVIWENNDRHDRDSFRRFEADRR
jgi:hypothetical protein